VRGGTKCKPEINNFDILRPGRSLFHHCCLRRRLASGRRYCGARRHAVTVCVCPPSRLYHVSTTRSISLGGEGNALYLFDDCNVDAVLQCRIITAWRWNYLATERLQRVKLSATPSTQLFPAVQQITPTDKSMWNVALMNRAKSTSRYVLSVLRGIYTCTQSVGFPIVFVHHKW